MTKRTRICAALLVLIVLLMTLPVSAEAATLGVYYRPALTFIVENAPYDLVLHMDVERDGEIIPVYLYRETRLWESYFRLYRQTSQDIHVWYGNRADFEGAVLVAETESGVTRIPIPDDILVKLSMNDYFMLDLSEGTISFGIPFWRTAALFLLRLVLTVLAALAVLYFFRYRWKKSWIAVLVTNLVCQAGLSFFIANWINYNPKIIIPFFMGIVVVLVLQIPIFWWLLDEDRSQRSVSFTFWSNVATGALNLLFVLHFPL